MQDCFAPGGRDVHRSGSQPDRGLGGFGTPARLDRFYATKILPGQAESLSYRRLGSQPDRGLGGFGTPARLDRFYATKIWPGQAESLSYILGTSPALWIPAARRGGTHPRYNAGVFFCWRQSEFRQAVRPQRAASRTTASAADCEGESAGESRRESSLSSGGGVTEFSHRTPLRPSPELLSI